jgi:hypothetical protein
MNMMIGKRYILFLASIAVLCAVIQKTKEIHLQPNIRVTISTSRDPVRHIDTPRNISAQEIIYVDVLKFNPAPVLTHSRLGALSIRSNYFMDLTTTAEVLTPGTYVLGVKSDDGFRLLVDGLVVLDCPSVQDYRLSYAEVPLSAGKHTFEINYFQAEGTQGLAAGYQLRGETGYHRFGESSPLMSFIPFDSR